MISDFIEDWVKICNAAREKVKAEHSALSLEDQCTRCEMVFLSALSPSFDLDGA